MCFLTSKPSKVVMSWSFYVIPNIGLYVSQTLAVNIHMQNRFSEVARKKTSVINCKQAASSDNFAALK